LVETVLLIVSTAPVFGIAVSEDPSPTNLAKMVPAEIVEKNPKLVEIEFVEILEAVSDPVLNNVVLMTGGI
jgi:hypothetical protein